MLKLTLIVLTVALPLINAYASCLEPVANEYIVVTKYPEYIFPKINIQTKLNAINNTIDKSYIYNHHSTSGNNLANKVTLSKKSIDTSTLLLKLTIEDLNRIKAIPETEIFSNCVVNLETSNSLNFDSNNNPNTSTANKLISTNVNDPYFSYQWGLQLINSNLPSATYDTSKKVRIAVSDTGFDYEHPDLINNLWINQAEANGQPNIDDDNNGCKDDIYGCDVTDQDGDISVNTFKSTLIDHGTHVAGIIGASLNNNLGIAGAAFDAEIMLIKAFSSKRKTTSADLLKSIYYAVNNNADVINCSWGTNAKPTLAEFNAFEYARINDVIVVTAAGNSSTYAANTSPAGLSNVLTVGSYNANLQMSTFSNFGTAVDIFAPGGDGAERMNDSIVSLGINGTYINKKGTSMAAPFVSAIIGNIKSVYPQLSRNEIINILLLSSFKKNVQAFYDPKFQQEALFINQAEALNVASDYNNKNYALTDLTYDPKTIVAPSSSNVSASSNNSNLTSTSSGSGCSNNNLNSNANLSFIFMIFPVLFILINRKNKNGR